MTSYTPNKGLAEPTVGADSGVWGTLLNGNAAILDNNLGGLVVMAVGGSANITVTSVQAQNLIQQLTGVLTGNINYILPAVGSFYVIDNRTTGSFTITVITAAGGSVGTVAPQGGKVLLYSDGTNVNVPRTAATPAVQVFTTSGTYTPTAGMQYCVVELRGGGGGGGGQGAGTLTGASGGGQGEYARGVFTAAQVGASKAVTIGPGGTAGAATGTTTGGVGGTTSFGSLLTAVGGAGGLAGNNPGVAGGTGGTGTGLHIAGEASGNGGPSVSGISYILGGSGAGGGGFGGMGGPGAAGVTYGSGGGGGGDNSAGNAPTAGGSGASGYATVTEYF